MATELKRNTHYSPFDWFTNNFAVSTNAERSRNASFATRQEGRFHRDGLAIETRWKQQNSNTKLSDRIEDIRIWKDILDEALNRVNKEIALLSEIKDKTEKQLAALECPLEVANENLTARDSRRAIDLVNDDADRELRKEIKVIEASKCLLQERCKQSFDQLLVLQEIRQELLRDLQDKVLALGIDVNQYNVSEFAVQGGAGSFKPDPCRVDVGTTIPLQWEDYSRYNRDRADAEVGASKRLRELMANSLGKVANDVAAQRNVVDYSLRKRIHEQERALEELEWQRRNMEVEIARLEAECRALEAAIRDKLAPLKLAMTRAENRHDRPNVELCLDDAQLALCQEIADLKSAIAALEERLKQARHVLQHLENNLHRVNDEIALKNESLRLDRRCMDARNARLHSGCCSDAPAMSMQNNLCLTGIERERTKLLVC